jgi:DNA polymerase III delta prime subunit
MNDQFLWVEKYRPKTIEDTILPLDLKATFQQFVDQKNIPNLILSGSAGVGKTTVARAMLEELGADYIVINGSMNGNIDTLRNEILNFASTISLSGGRKYVILDEADYLNANSTQPALRNFMEEFSKNCGFILTCNFKNRIIEPLHSRCSVIDFKIGKKDMAKLAMQFMKRVNFILNIESIKYESAVVAEVIQKYFPDWRRVLNELQRYSATGAIDSGILSNMQATSIKGLVDLMKGKNYAEMRNWINVNLDTDVNDLYRQFYDTAYDLLETSSIPVMVLTIAKYQYQGAFAADPQINFMAFLTEVMIQCDFQ